MDFVFLFFDNRNVNSQQSSCVAKSFFIITGDENCEFSHQWLLKNNTPVSVLRCCPRDFDWCFVGMFVKPNNI